jgi:hexosaminidase
MNLRNFLLGLCALPLAAAAQEPLLNVIPAPESLQFTHPGVMVSCANRAATVHRVAPSSAMPAEGYRLVVSPDSLVIVASSDAGEFYARQTLAQAMDSLGRVPAMVIEDAPRFPYRGLMIDVSRHFFGKDYIKKQIDALSRYKINRLHLHLTDAAGWRLEITQYPRLTQLAAWRPDSLWSQWNVTGRRYVEQGTPGAYGGYFTEADIREIVDYAAERFITVIPEIEMPSHSEEVLTAYPELSCTHEPYKQSDFCPGSEKTFEFLEGVLTEVMRLFPSEYIHIGGDEAPKTSWHDCPLCRQRMAQLGLTDVEQLQGYMMQRVADFLAQHGRKIIGWDEMMQSCDSLPAGAAVMAWRGVDWGYKAADSGHQAILTPGDYCYLDFYQDAPYSQPEAIGGYLPLEKVYAFSPESRPGVAGVQGNVWAEHIPSEAHDEWMIYPRALALAEVGWSQPQRKDYADFRRRALKAVEQLHGQGYNCFDLAGEVGNRPETQSIDRHLAYGKPVTYNEGCRPNANYTAGGDSALTDGVRGGWTYLDKHWQGMTCDMDVTIDLQKKTSVSSIAAGFMQICGPWVFFPEEVEILISGDGKNFTSLATIPQEKIRDGHVRFRDFQWTGKSRRCRYVRVRARLSDTGGFIFIDEIRVN